LKAFQHGTGEVAPTDPSQIFLTNVVDTFKTDAGITLNGSDVSSWLGSKGHDLAQIIVGRQPLFNTGGGPTGGDVVEATSAVDALIDSSITGAPSASGNAHILMVAQIDVDGSAKFAGGYHGVTERQLLFSAHNDNMRAQAWNDGAARTTTVGLTDHTNSWRLFEVSINGTELAVWLDGVKDSTFTLTNTGLDSDVDEMLLLNLQDGNSSAPSILVAEAVFLSAIADSNEYTKYKSYVGSEYGISVA
jgi:hypothetical protein